MRSWQAKSRIGGGALAGALFAVLAAGSATAQIDVTNLLIVKGQDFVNGTPDTPDPWRFEGCIEVANPGAVASATLTPPGGIPQALTLLGPAEYCLDGNFADQAALDAAFPSTGGVYTFSLTPSGGGGDIAYTRTFNAVAPEGVPLIARPENLENVIADRDLTVDWELSSACASCDAFAVSLGTDEDSDVFLSVIPNPSATTQNVDALVLEPGTVYSLEVESVDGGTGTDTQNADTFDWVAVYAHSNQIEIAGVARSMDLDVVELVKFTDREDGVLTPLPYGLAACVRGDGIDSASLDTPSGPLALEDLSEDVLCSDSSFATPGERDAAYPSSGQEYVFQIRQADGGLVEVPLEFDEEAPGASIVIESPADNSTVPEGQDLPVAWSLDRGDPECVIGLDCGLGIVFRVMEETEAGFMALFEQVFDIEETSSLIPDEQMLLDRILQIQLETFNGNPSEMLIDGEGEGSDSFSAAVLFQDMNTVEVMVPEPGATGLGLMALAALGALARRRRQSP